HLHEPPAPECGYITWRQLEPLSVSTFVAEPLMPILFDANRIIGLDLVDHRSLLRQLNGQFVLPAPRRVSPANLVETTSLHEIDEPDDFGLATGVNRAVRTLDSDRPADFRHLFEPVTIAAVVDHFLSALSLSTNPLEYIMARKPWVRACPHAKISSIRETTK